MITIGYYVDKNPKSHGRRQKNVSCHLCGLQKRNPSPIPTKRRKTGILSRMFTKTPWRT